MMLEFFDFKDESMFEIYMYAKTLSHILFSFTISFYLILNLQWYNYKLNRVLFKHHKQKWHIFIFVLPLLAYFLTYDFFWVFFYFTYIPLLLKWHKKLDKKLIFTPRVKRFFYYLIASSIFVHFYAFFMQIKNPHILTLLSIAMSIVSMNLNEKILFIKYKKMATNKLSQMSNLNIIQITASFGKTSIKNFIYELLKEDFNVRKTPKSINTINGIIKDINEKLTKNTQIYIVESGARQENDILQITQFLAPNYVVLGKIGMQHIEYFQSLENIAKAKAKILLSKRLKLAFINKANILDENTLKDIPQKKVKYYPDGLEIVSADLRETNFYLNLNGKKTLFNTKLLGKLNPENISVAVMIAYEFGVSEDKLPSLVNDLNYVPHRLEKISNMGKIIIDDSYNSNFEGMKEAIELVRQQAGRKIIVTCGLVESTKSENVKIAKLIDEVFSVAIITAELNKKILEENITKTQKFTLTDKSKLEYFLSTLSKSGDVILFANDAPNYI